MSDEDRLRRLEEEIRRLREERRNHFTDDSGSNAGNTESTDSTTDDTDSTTEDSAESSPESSPAHTESGAAHTESGPESSPAHREHFTESNSAYFTDDSSGETAREVSEGQGSAAGLHASESSVRASEDTVDSSSGDGVKSGPESRRTDDSLDDMEIAEDDGAEHSDNTDHRENTESTESIDDRESTESTESIDAVSGEVADDDVLTDDDALIEDGEDIEDEEEDSLFYKVFRVRFTVPLVIMMVVVFGLSVGSAVLVDQWNRDRQASDLLNQISEQRTEMAALNTEVLDFSAGGYALGVGGDGNYPEHGAFVFGGEDSQDPRRIDVYVDYSSQRSVDFLMRNSSHLMSMVESGEVELRIHPVPSEHHFSLYSAETIAQTMHRHPEKAWEVNLSMLQIFTEIQDTDDSDITAEGIVDLIVTEMEDIHDIDDIDKELILEGQFSQWIESTKTDPQLSQAGQAPPLVYAEGDLVDSSAYYNPDELQGAVMGTSDDAGGSSDSDVVDTGGGADDGADAGAVDDADAGAGAEDEDTGE